MSAGRRRERRADLLCVAGATAALGLYWFLRVVPRAVPRPGLVGSDLLHQFFPDHAYLAERLRAGSLPLWNPYQGQPFLATLLPGTFYPARGLLLVLDTPAAMHVSTVAHLLLGVVATWALCRALGASRPGALAGAATFTGVHALPNVYTPAFLEGGTWLPVAGLALVRFAATGAWRWALALGASMGLVVLAGCYQHALYAAYGVGVLGLALLADPERRGELARPAGVGGLVVAAALALATAAPQLLPTLAWSAETVRSGASLTDTQIDPFPFPWRSLRSMFVPPDDYAGIYLSVPVAVLAVLGGVRGGRAGRVLLVATAIASLLLMGRGTPVFALVRVLPGFASFRGPERLAFLVAFLAAVGVSLGTTRLGRPWLAAAATAAVAWALFAPPRAPVAFPWTVPAELLEGPLPIMRAIETHTRGGRTLLPGGAAADGLGAKQATLHHVLGLQDYNPLSSRRLATYLRAVVGKPPPRRDDPDFFLGFVAPNQPIVRPELLDAMSVRTLLVRSGVRVPARTPVLRLLVPGDRWTLWENPAALPRAFAVGRARPVPDYEAAIAALGEPGFDARREVALVAAPSDEELAAVTSGAAEPLREATVVDDAPERVAIDVDVARPSVVVLTDPFAPGWSATVNGAPARLREANGLARGVIVPAGRSRVDFTYRAPGLRAGAIAFAAGWALALAAALARRVRSGRARSPRR